MPLQQNRWYVGQVVRDALLLITIQRKAGCLSCLKPQSQTTGWGCRCNPPWTTRRPRSERIGHLQLTWWCSRWWRSRFSDHRIGYRQLSMLECCINLNFELKRYVLLRHENQRKLTDQRNWEYRYGGYHPHLRRPWARETRLAWKLGEVLVNDCVVML